MNKYRNISMHTSFDEPPRPFLNTAFTNTTFLSSVCTDISLHRRLCGCMRWYVCRAVLHVCATTSKEAVYENPARKLPALGKRSFSRGFPTNMKSLKIVNNSKRRTPLNRARQIFLITFSHWKICET